MAATTQFHLTSSQTALAFVIPSHLQPEINSLRRIHDKAFRKWEPHINILYPFVEPSLLPEAIAILQGCLRERQKRKIIGSISEVGVFRHRKNATVFLKPESKLEEDLCNLRGLLTAALGCSESEGTHDGTYRPHLTVGQAGLNGDAVERLKEQVSKLVSLHVDVKSLVVLKREVTGEMKAVEELDFGLAPELTEFATEVDGDIEDNVWHPCYSFNSDSHWESRARTEHSLDEYTKTQPIQFSISTYNVMAEVSATPFPDRLPLIIEALSSAILESPASLRVLCLQEVNAESLPLLLAEPFIQQNFPFSSHSPSSLLPSHRNLVTLASENFKHSTLQFTELHKSALTINFPGASILVSNVHLTSGLGDQAVVSKKNQMVALTRFVQDSRKHSGHEIFLAGDFNLTTSSRTIETALANGTITPITANVIASIIDDEVWEDAFTTCGKGQYDGEDLLLGEEGATFDRTTNPFAMVSNLQFDRPVDRSPQRYDRILFHKGGYVHAENFEIFGQPNENGECGSDHYGVTATFRLGEKDLASASPGPVKQISISTTPDIELVEDSTDLTPLLDPYLPTADDKKQRKDAIALIEQAFAADQSHGGFVLGFLGSYLMETDFPESDVDILVLGSVAPTPFFEFAMAQLRAIEGDERGVKRVHLVNSLVPIIELVALGIKFDIQYCRAEELVERFHTKPNSKLSDLAFDDEIMSTLRVSSLRPLNTYRDSAYILRTIPDVPAYRTAHRFLSLYLKRRGLYSAKFGYLGGIHLSLMLNRVVKLLHAKLNLKVGDESNEVKNPPSPAMLIRTFFAYYAAFSWTKDRISDPMLSIKSPRTSREPVFIQATQLPTNRPNVAASCTRLSAETFTAEFQFAADKLTEGDWTWCLRPKEATIVEFMNGFGAFVRIAMDVWGVDEIGGDKVREMVGCLESRITRLMVGLGRLDGVYARAWPARFCTPITAEERDDETQFKGFYLVGVSAKGKDNGDRKRLLSGKVVTTVREFERSVKDLREFQNGNVWLDMDVIPKKKLLGMGLILDERNWSSAVARPPSPEPEAPNYSEDDDSDQQVALKAKVAKSAPSKQSGSISLRPAQDIIARIKWDPKLKADDFLIGYEDRFVGVKETDLGKWKSEQTDEEFIPMHRIVWVRRKSDGEKVWDRRNKVDLLFGSGRGGRSGK